MAPRLAGTDDGIQGDDELPHNSGDDDFAGLAVAPELFSEEAHDGIVLDGDESRHVQRFSDSGSSRLDMARALDLAAIVIDGRKAHKAGDLAPGECAEFRQISQHGRDGRRADAFEGSHEARLARQHSAGAEMRRDLGLKRRQGFAKAGEMRLQASADDGVAGMLQPVGFREEHLLNLVAPSFQVSKRQNLWRQRNVKPKILGLKPIKGENAGVDWICFRDKAEIPGEMANACAMRLVYGDAKLHADRKNMALVAAGGLADSQHRAKAALGVAPHFGNQRFADCLRLVRRDALLIGGENMNNQAILGDFERNDVIECA